MMGDITVKNERDFLLPAIAVEGTQSIRQCAEAICKSRGVWPPTEFEWGRIRFSVELVVAKLLTVDGGPVIEPASMTTEQECALAKWYDENSLDAEVGNIFETIEWQFCAGWREKYPELPRWEGFDL
jgi:hypothetical protein